MRTTIGSMWLWVGSLWMMCKMLSSSSFVVNGFSISSSSLSRLPNGEKRWSSSSLLAEATAGTTAMKEYDAVIVGGGPAGWLTAISLAQEFGPEYKMAICEQREAPSTEDLERLYLLGIGFRGQTALKKFGVWEDFESNSVPVHGRRDWAPGTGNSDGQITYSNKSVTSRILSRKQLIQVISNNFIQNHPMDNIDILYGHQVSVLNFDTEEDPTVQIQISKCIPSNNDEEVPECDIDNDTPQVVRTSLLVGADGSARTIANAMEQRDQEIRKAIGNPIQRFFYQPFQITRYTDDNPRVFKSVPIQLPADWPGQLNYSARSTDSRVTLEALPFNEQGKMCALLLMKPSDPFAQPNVNVDEFSTFFQTEFPQFYKLLTPEEIAAVAQKPPSALPAFRYVSPKLHVGKCTVILGDSAHTVKPYYGLGANSAMEDVVLLSDCVAESNKDTTKAIQLFSQRRGSDCQALVKMSRNMDRPGFLFVTNFLAPLILDGIFHKYLPKVFGPNMFQMFQKQDMTFTQIQRKKRIDRLLQVSILTTILTTLATTTLHILSKLTGISKVNILTKGGGTAIALLAASNILKKLLSSKSSSKQTEATA